PVTSVTLPVNVAMTVLLRLPFVLKTSPTTSRPRVCKRIPGTAESLTRDIREYWPMDHRFRIALFAAAVLPSLLYADQQPGITRWSLTVTEREGIRRFGFPVHAALAVDRVLLDRGQFRLLQNDRPVSAQFSPHRDGEKGPASVSVDFNVNHAPLE